jgi:hypothetical protein
MRVVVATVALGVQFVCGFLLQLPNFPQQHRRPLIVLTKNTSLLLSLQCREAGQLQDELRPGVRWYHRRSHQHFVRDDSVRGPAGR